MSDFLSSPWHIAHRRIGELFKDLSEMKISDKDIVDAAAKALGTFIASYNPDRHKQQKIITTSKNSMKAAARLHCEFMKALAEGKKEIVINGKTIKIDIVPDDPFTPEVEIRGDPMPPKPRPKPEPD